MTAALIFLCFACVVALSIAVAALASANKRTAEMSGVTEEAWLDFVRESRKLVAAFGERQASLLADEIREARTERETLLRAILARSTPEFATLERIETERRKLSAPPSRQMTREEYDRALRADLEGMGIDADAVPSVPEGL